MILDVVNRYFDIRDHYVHISHAILRSAMDRNLPENDTAEADRSESFHHREDHGTNRYQLRKLLHRVNGIDAKH